MHKGSGEADFQLYFVLAYAIMPPAKFGGFEPLMALVRTER